MRRSTQSEKVLKSISIALAAMVAGTTVMGSMGTMTVYAAEESSELEKSDPPSDHDFDAIDENADKYTNIETSGAASVAEMNESVEKANDALKEVNKLVNDFQDELTALETAQEEQKNNELVDDLDTVGTEANEVVEKANNAAEDAQGVAKNATDKVDAIAKETDAYNNLVNDGNATDGADSDQEKVDAVNVDGLEVTYTNEDGAEVTKDLKDYVSDKAIEAEEAKKEAYNALKDALAVDTKEVNDEVLEKVDAVKEAADKAQQAADDAQIVYNIADKSYEDAIDEYNFYAILYGKDLYVREGKSYEDGYAEKILNEKGFTLDATRAEKEGLTLARSLQKKDIEDDTNELKDDIEKAETTLETQRQTIEAQKTALDTASGNLANAEKAAEAAQAAVDLALKGIDINDDGDKEDVEEGDKKGIVDFVDEAKEASDDVANYYVDPAIEAEEVATKDVAQKKSDLQTAKENQAKVNAEQDAIISSNTTSKTSILDSSEYKDVAKIVNDAEKENWLGISELDRKKTEAKYAINKKDRKKAQAYVDAYYAAKKIKDEKDKVIASYDSAIQNAEAAKTAAQVKVNNCQTAYDDANNKLAAATDAKNAAVAKRVSIINDVNAAYEKQAVNAMVDAIKGELDGLSVDVNQVEFDRDLNEWANNFIRIAEESNGLFDWLGNRVEAYYVRDYMDDNYEIGRLNEILNTFGITEWLVSTENTEKIMAATIEAYRSAMKTDEEKMATVNAYYAYLQAAKQQGVAENALTDINTYISSVKTAQTALKTAQENLNIAKDNYDTAAANLKDAKEKLANLEFNDIKLGELEKKILAAQVALEDAAMKLEEAQASATTAQVYKQWAENLINPQEARCYVNILEDKTGIDDSDKNVTSRPSKNYENVSPIVDNKVVKQTVPYELYKQYVSWLMKYRTEASQINNANLPTGKGIATGENGSLGIVYWETDENGKIKLDENGQAIFHYDGENLAAGRYFVAYVFKHESDGYHFDGVYVDVEENKQPELPPEVTDGEDDPSPTTVIDDQPVALAASVLGAERARAVENADEQIMVDQNGDVLGADRTPTGDVLGAGRPQTGDYTNTGIALFGAVASGMMLLGYGLKKKKEDEAEEC